MFSKLFLLLGFLSSLFLFFKLTKDDIKLVSLRVREETIFNIFFASTVGAILGARVFYVATHFEKFGLSPLKWFLFTHFPGLSFLGAILGLEISLWWILKKTNLSIARIFDLATLSFGPVIILGFLGSRLFIEAAIFLFLQLILFKIYRWAAIFSLPGTRQVWRLNSSGLIFLIFLLFFSFFWFLLDFIRKNDKILVNLLTIEQLVSLLIFFIALWFFLKRVKKQKI